MSRGLKIALFSGLGLVLVIGLVLLGLIFGARPPFEMVFDPELPGDFAPGASVTVDGRRIQEKDVESFSFSFRTNSLGFRGLEVELGQESRPVIVIGDGFGFGTAVDGERTLSDELNRIMAEEPGGLVSVNASAPGYNLVDEFEYMKEKGHRLRPSLLVIVQSYDDVWEMARPIQVRELNRCVAEHRFCVVKAMYYRFRHGLFRMRDVVTAGRRNPKAAWRELLEPYLALLSELHAWLQERGCRLLIVVDRFEYPEMGERLSAIGAPHLVLADVDEARIELAPDGHWTASTHRFAAELVADWIKKTIR